MGILNIISDPIQLKIFSHLTIIELITIINILSKQHNQIISKDELIWKQLTVKTLGISGQRVGFRNMNGCINIHKQSFKNPPHHFLSKIKLIPLNLDEIKISPGFKPWCQHIPHQKCM